MKGFPSINTVRFLGGFMKEYTIDYISNLTQKVNETRSKLFEIMKWEQKLPLSDGDVRIVLETEQSNTAERRKNAR